MNKYYLVKSYRVQGPFPLLLPISNNQVVDEIQALNKKKAIESFRQNHDLNLDADGYAKDGEDTYCVACNYRNQND